MSDIIKTFYEIGNIYEERELIVKNDAYKYEKVQVYLFDIGTKTITPNLNISKDSIIITRFGVGANSGNLFPNQFFKQTDVKNRPDKFIKGILSSCKNLLSKFLDDEIEKDEILRIIKNIDVNFFNDKLDEILKLQEYKEKGRKTATYFALSYKEKPISAYFKKIYKTHISTVSNSNVYGYDIFTNETGIGGDANLAFCSVNELPKNLQYLKSRLLPLNSQNAKVVKIGYDVMDRNLSHNFFGLKMAILPTVIPNNIEILETVLKILEQIPKGNLSEIKGGEAFIKSELEDISLQIQKYPVLSTILFYEKNNAAVNLLLAIDDILPSYITHISRTLAEYDIKTFIEKGTQNNIIFLQKLFSDKLEIMQILLTAKKLDLEILVSKIENFINYGNNNKAYLNLVSWDKFFNNYYPDRNMDAIRRYINFFNAIGKINFTLQQEINMQDLTLKEIIYSITKNNKFLEDKNLKSSYLLGMLSSAIINWQYGVSQSSSYANWLNNLGVINKSKLDKIYKKCDETIRKISATSGKSNKTIDYIKEELFETLGDTLSNNETTKSSYITLAFAMGGSDFNRYSKEKN